ncbi:MAG: hypothetical protein GZ089_11405 [Aromatoleum sp.]|nr:hypothetical protein [Aromatoleum sp.]
MKTALGLDDSGHWYDEVKVGDAFSRTLTVTDTHLVLGAGLIGDFNPHHVNECRNQSGTTVAVADAKTLVHARP